MHHRTVVLVIALAGSIAFGVAPAPAQDQKQDKNQEQKDEQKAKPNQKPKPKTIEEQVDELWEEVDRLLTSDKPLEVVGVMERMIKLNPKDVRVWSYLAWHQAYNLSIDRDLKLNEDEQVQKGIATLKRAVAAVPQSADLRFDLGFTIFDRAGDLPEAARVFEQALRLVDQGKIKLVDPEEKRPVREWRRHLMRNLAHVYERMIEFERAADFYDRISREYEDEDVARFTSNYLRNDYGEAYRSFKAGQYREALVHTDASLAKKELMIGLYLKAECHLKLGETEEARKSYERILERNLRERVAINQLKKLEKKGADQRSAGAVA